MDNIGSNGAIVGDPRWISQKTLETLRRYRIYSGDVLISIAGSIGRVAVFNEAAAKGPTILTENAAKLHAGVGVLPEYLSFLLSSQVLQLQMKRDYIQTTIPKLGLDRIRKLRVPPIPAVTQQEVVIRLWKEAIGRHTVLVEKAAALFAGVDDYLLGELGIVLPVEVESTIASRMFSTQRRNLSGWRFDARVHRKKFQLASSRFQNVSVNAVAHINPHTNFEGVQDTSLLTFVPMEAISDVDGTVSWPQERTFSENIGYTSFQEGDLLWAKITPCMENGKSAVAHGLLHGYGFGSTEYHVIRPRDESVSVNFLHALFRMKAVRLAAESYFGGSSGHQRVDEAFFFRLSIPLPDMVTQKRLVEHIGKMRLEAQRLRRDAEIELSAAKQRIEAKLLGDPT